MPMTEMPVASIKENRGPDFSVYRFEYLIEKDGWYGQDTFGFGLYEGDHPNLKDQTPSRFCKTEDVHGVTVEGFKSGNSKAVSYLASRAYSNGDEFMILSPTKAHFWFDTPPEEWGTGINEITVSFFGNDLDFSECS